MGEMDSSNATGEGKRKHSQVSYTGNNGQVSCKGNWL